ncbi:MAG: FixH family protein [Armatimonadetes bacterium]|nr:FixH family protein [Armatimonadota bacterium]
MRRVNGYTVGLVVALALCTAHADTLTGRAGPFALSVMVQPDPPVLGSNEVTVTLTDSAGKPVNGASVKVTVARRGGDQTEAEAGGFDQQGGYLAKVELPVKGRYDLRVDVTSGGRGGHDRFVLITGNQTHQPPARGVRWVWIWLIVMIAGPLLVSVLPARVVPHARRGVVAGVVVLVAAFLLGREVVHTFRRPGQMGVIEAQAMDMTAMKPPVGVVPVVIEEVKPASFESAVSYTGSVVPYNQQDVYPRVTGVLVDMPVYPGDRVKRGDVVARLDTTELSSKVNEATLSHLAAQEAAGAARADARRADAGVDEARAELRAAEHAVSQSGSDRAAAAAMVRRAESELDTARARVGEAESSVAAAQAGRRTASAMTEEGRAAVKQAQADRTTAGSAVVEAEENLTVAQRAVSESERKVDGATAGRDKAAAELSARRAELPQVQADVAAMQADVDYWVPELKRMKALLKDGAVSQEEYDKEKAQSDQASAKLANAKAMVDRTTGMITASEAESRAADAELAGAREALAGAQAMVRAAQAKVAQAKSMTEGQAAEIGRREADVTSRSAGEDEAGSMITMREAELRRMKAEVQSAQAALEQAREELNAKGSAVSQMKADVQRRQASLRAMLADAGASAARVVEAARMASQRQAAAFTAGTIEGYTTIRAEVDGVVTERVTAPPTLVQPGALLLRIAEISRVRIQAAVAIADAGQIHRGAGAEVIPRKDPERRDRTVVSAVFPASDPSSRTTLVEALLDNPAGRYLPGDFVSLRVDTGRGAAAGLTVPVAAVVQVPAEAGQIFGRTRPAVWMVSGGGGGGGKTEYYCTMHPEVVSDKPGNCPKCGMALTPRQVGGGGGGKTEYYCTMHPEVVSDKPGNCPKCGMALTPREPAGGGAEKTEYYCTMHPEVVSDKPGNCPKCGMALTPRKVSGQGTARRVPVEIGASNGERVQVLAGLKPGDRVIVGGFQSLKDGDRVSPTTWTELSVPAVGSVSGGGQSDAGGTGGMPGMPGMSGH